ncbi:MAG: radical SAM family heme chaperone HemW [Vampirovibrionales bacterium]|nr:radical SAM family heme chaperone HemW [Vampirovibrionales bacterium]
MNQVSGTILPFHQAACSAQAQAAYIHVPFCRSRCLYCDFYVVLEKYGGQDAFAEALCQEIASRLACLNFEPAMPFKSLYVGGGTPTLLPAGVYQQIFRAFSLAGAAFAYDCERTLEANPDDWADSPEAYLDAGFNRVSLGVQSLDDDVLKRLSRRHSAETALNNIAALSRAGFGNISVDLMYGLPGQTLESWRETLAQVAQLPVQHVSAYGLTVHQETGLGRLQAFAQYQPATEAITLEMYQLCRQLLAKHGFEAYEFSNFARPGYESWHNLNYWRNNNWWAFGPGAHGQIGHTRYENLDDLAQYLQDPLKAHFTLQTPQEQLENTFIFGLRTHEGVDWQRLRAGLPRLIIARIEAILSKWQQRGVLNTNYLGRICLAPAYIAQSNYVIQDFIGLAS